MFCRNTIIRYTNKNFKEHMKISDNVTMRGIIRRYERKYPRFFGATKKSFVISGLIVLMLATIPGTQFPLQKHIKASIFGFSSQLSRLWFYNSLTPQPGNYLLKLNQFILLALREQIYDINVIKKYFDQIRLVVDESKKTIKTHSFIDILLYSELILQNMIRYQNRMLLEPQFKEYYRWILDMSIEHLESAKIKEKQVSSTVMFYSVVQYLLNYCEQEDKLEVIHKISQLIGSFKDKKSCESIQQNSFAYLVTSQGLIEKKFINKLKEIYSQTASQTTKTEIIFIFQCLDNVYFSKLNNQKIKS